MSPQSPRPEPAPDASRALCAEVELAALSLCDIDENEVSTHEHADWAALFSHLESCTSCAQLVERARGLLTDLPAALDDPRVAIALRESMPEDFEDLAGFHEQKPSAVLERELTKLFAASPIQVPDSLDAKVFAALGLRTSQMAAASPNPVVLRPRARNARAVASLAAACLLGFLLLFSQGILNPSDDLDFLLVVEPVDAPLDTAWDFNAFAETLADPLMRPQGSPWSRKGRGH